MEIWEYLILLLVIILSIVIGSKVVHKDNFAVITGEIALAGTDANAESSTQTIWYEDFPEGFNKDNCVCIAFGGRLFDDRGLGYGTGKEESVGLISGDIPRSITIGSKVDTNKIGLMAYNIANTAKNYEYKIVLMKIN